MKTIILLLMLISLSSLALGQASAKPQVVTSKTTLLGSVELPSIKLGIERFAELKRSFEESGITFARGSSQLQKDTAVKVEFIKYELSGRVNLSDVVELLEPLGYRPATIEEAGSIDSVKVPGVAGESIYILGTQLMLNDDKSLIFNVIYSTPEIAKGITLSPSIIKSSHSVEGTVVIAAVRSIK